MTILDPDAASEAAQLVYSSFFGGRAKDDRASIALGADDAIYVAGKTSSSDFPIWPIPGAFDTTYDGEDAVFLKLDRVPPPVCGDGDCDSGEDPCSCVDCLPSASEVNCSDGLDDDCDGFVDCADTDCATDASCQGGDCLGNKAPCTQDSDCCSYNCNRGRCKGGGDGSGGAVVETYFLRGDSNDDGAVDLFRCAVQSRISLPGRCGPRLSRCRRCERRRHRRPGGSDPHALLPLFWRPRAAGSVPRAGSRSHAGPHRLRPVSVEGDCPRKCSPYDGA